MALFTDLSDLPNSLLTDLQFCAYRQGNQSMPSVVRFSAKSQGHIKTFFLHLFYAFYG